MREWSKLATTLLLGFGLGIFFLYLYLSHLSFNYTFDGLAFSAQVEKDNLPLHLYFHPHHLLYTFLGRLFFLWGRAHGATWDGLVALQFFNLLTGVVGILILFHLMVRETNDRLAALLSASGLAFTHSYWYFSTIPGVRVFATVTPLLAWYVLTYLRNKPPFFGWILGAAHALAVLGHQTNLLLVLAFLGGIFLIHEKTRWERLRASLYYLASLSALVLAAYAVVGRYVYFRKTYHDWLWWVFSYFHASQKWGGYFKPSGFERGGGAMVHAFLPGVPSLKALYLSLTYGTAETILQNAVLVLLALLLLRLGHHWAHHRQAVWVSVLWLTAFVPFFVWWEPWNIEFWVSSTIPCWVLMGLVVSDLSQWFGSPIIRWANRSVALAAGSCLLILLFTYNVQGSAVKSRLLNHYDYKGLLGALDWKVRVDDLLVLDGINNVHYYVDRFQKRKYLSLYNFLRTYKTIGDKETGKTPEKESNAASMPYPDPWADLSRSFQQTWKHHRKVWILTEAVDDFDGGRQLLEETLKLPEGRVREFFEQYQLKPITYSGRVYFYEVLKPLPVAAPASAPETLPRIANPTPGVKNKNASKPGGPT